MPNGKNIGFKIFAKILDKIFEQSNVILKLQGERTEKRKKREFAVPSSNFSGTSTQQFTQFTVNYKGTLLRSRAKMDISVRNVLSVVRGRTTRVLFAYNGSIISAAD